MTSPEVAANHVLQETGLARIPIPIDAIARKLDVYVSYRPLDGDTSGMLFREADRAAIGVNSTHPVTRQRFTIAHEIGHLRLHKGRPLIVDAFVRINRRDGVSSAATDAEEIQANAFAAALLMPAALLRDELAHTRHRRLSQDELTEELAKRFNVSSQAMTYRLINLGLLKTAP